MTFYEEARSLWITTQEDQMKKGLEKYGEPFDPFSWSPEQLLNHFIQENVDQQHYAYGLYKHIAALQEEVKTLREEKDALLRTLHSKVLAAIELSEVFPSDKV